MRRSSARLLVAGLLAGLTGITALARGGHRSPPPPLPRLAAFALNCFVPTSAGLHTRATLMGKITLANRTVFTTADCTDGPSLAAWPAFDASDGEVLGVDLGLTTILADADGRLLAVKPCWAYSGNGFVTLRCAADPQQGGEVEVLVSIAP
jgi:hypothetical protein